VLLSGRASPVLPCAFDDMSTMATRKENMNGVQQELLRIIQSDVLSKLLDKIVDRIREIEAAYEAIRQLRETVKPLLPNNSEYNEKYWMAAYILYPKSEELLEKLKRFKEAYLEMKKLKKVIKSHKEEKEKLKDSIKLFEREIKYLEQDIEESLSENLGYYLSFSICQLERMLWRIMTDYYNEYYEKAEK
jgi:DNA repair exonuclease SbcCD ATPase subunit